MPPAAPETLIPVTALVFPLTVGLALLVGGIAALRSPARGGGPLPPSLRIATGAALLLAGGAAFTVAALGAVALCTTALVVAFSTYGRTRAPSAGAARLAGAAALLTFATVTALEGLLGFGGVAAHLSRFDLRDLSWAAALLGVLAVSSLLQLGATRSRSVVAVDPTDGEVGRLF
ncbi:MULTISPECIES: hypothetical protein [unclassified Rathayibacter]|uniref:hypothetical protein n=1 Tax=unclassified Rathayibacter TaxID=2609250 RepID=UPI0006F82AFB|nr:MULTISPECIES: hypothetical protein [unclassified Rathayibacter]KQQ05976.1 hypothetical protein ASF42_05410 [Rathayibacter sp. Leaf294]KQS13833.1 hypothetical protein ASG06_05420 [Rathayibacter sp. Leaf185]